MERWDILYAGYVGLGGTFRLIEERRISLEEHFSLVFFRCIEACREYLVKKEQLTSLEKLIAKEKDGFLYPIEGESVFAALWKMAEKRQEYLRQCGLTGVQGQVGLIAELDAMPIRQETIEICEYEELHPYEMRDWYSALLLINADHTRKVLREIRKQNMAVVRIGALTNGKARKLTLGERVRYLEKPRVPCRKL